MLINNFKIAWRSLRKQPFFTLLNTFGLAVGMAGTLLISLYIIDELSFDRMFDDADRIFRVDIDHRVSGEDNSYANAPGPMANVLREDCPQIEKVCRFRDMNSILIRRPDAELNVKEEFVVGVDSSFFDMFGIQLLEGDPNTALINPNTIVLTKSAAAKHFGNNQAVGKSLKIDDSEIYYVTGVMADLPKNSMLRGYNVFLSIESFDDAKSIAWSNWNYPTFAKLLPAAKKVDFDNFLGTVKEKYLIPWAMTFIPGLTVESARENDKASGNFMNFNSIALTDIHLHSSGKSGEFNPNSDIQNIYILSFIGLFLILLAIVNFMNLSTAQSLKRAKEVGIRKTLGSSKLALVKQFLTEAGMVSLLSMIAALGIAELALPYFNDLSGKSLSMPFALPGFWAVLLIATTLLGLISGSYPAFFMSRFLPVTALKGNGQNSAGGGNIRNSLVVFQFAISVFLMVGTLVVFQQISFIQNKDLGFQKDQVLIINDVYPAQNQLQTFKQEVLQLGQVESVSLSSFLPTPSARNGITFFKEGKLESANAAIFENWGVDHDYIQTLNLELIEGRNFEMTHATDSSAMIVNESVLTMLRVSAEEAIGLRLTHDFQREDKENMAYSTIIGVIKNFHFESLRTGIDAMSLSLGTNAKKMMVKLNPGDFTESIADIKAIWKEIAPGQPFNYYFMDDSFNKVYEAEINLGRIFITFTILSLLIACLGLFGLASFNAEKRTKEIGIRKVLGASVSQITYRLAIDFLKLVGIAIIIAIPAGWYAMHKWLQDFTYRIEMSWSLFAMAALLVVVISILTVSYQSIRAAIANPIESLRNE